MLTTIYYLSFGILGATAVLVAAAMLTDMRPHGRALQSDCRRPWRRCIPLLVGALLLATAIDVQAQSKPPMIADALSMLQAFRNLDGRQVIVKVNGADTPVMTPWDFASGTLRLRIARNISALAAVEKDVEETRQSIVKEILKGMPAGSQITPGTPEFEVFSLQIADALKQPAAVTLSRIKASELRLDKNEIPITALSALAPILDDDVSPK